MNENIILRGARENNLKNIDLEIPKGKLVVFTGVSGSGKSSLVFDTIAVESIRQLSETLPPYVRSRMPHYEAPHIRSMDHLSPAVVVDQRPFTGDIRSTVATMTDIAPMLRLLFSRCASPRIGASPAYSCNDPQGMCPACSGLGYTVQFDPEKLFDRSKSLDEGAILFPGHHVKTYQWQLYANSGFLDPEKKLEDYSAQEWQDFLHGSGRIVDIHNTTGRVWGDYQLTYEGFLDRITRLYLKRDANALSKSGQRILRDFTERCICPMCHGARLNAVALGSRLAGRNIAEMGELEVSELIPVLKTITNPVGVPLVCKIVRVLEGIENMGLGYLSLNRSSVTLSGGEAQRLRMVRHLGSSLTGLTYIFDEPTSGLHPKDAARLSDLLLRLRDRGNTVLVVEHNRQIIRIADQVIDLGPGAGRNGGQVLFQGTPGALLHADTPTAHSLRRRDRLNRAPRTPSGWLEIAHARLHNLKDVSVRIPQGVLTVVSGLAGSGKSSLACGELLRQHPDAVHISQAPIGTTSRSNPATYIGVMDEIRRLFARANGVEAARFSYNSKGACPACEGRGVIKTEMAFMDPVTIPCEACQGSRYSASTLRYLYQGKNILEVLSMTVDEAMEFFDTPKVWEKLRVLRAVGMGYLTLGQPTSTLSGGECQRMKLASHLNGQNGLYILDEPAVGLHGQDVARLLEVLDDLTRRSNTIVVIEHHLDVIAHADWVIDMGPEGGKRGGQVLFSGTPEQLLSVEHSATAEYLRDALRDVW